MSNTIQRETKEYQALDHMDLVLDRVTDQGTTRYEVIEQFEDGTEDTMTFGTYRQALQYFHKYIEMAE